MASGCRIGKNICSQKDKYTRIEAGNVCYLAKKSRGVTLRKYHCQYCKWWHVTSKTLEEYEQTKKEYGG